MVFVNNTYPLKLLNCSIFLVKCKENECMKKNTYINGKKCIKLYAHVNFQHAPKKCCKIILFKNISKHLQ